MSVLVFIALVAAAGTHSETFTNPDWGVRWLAGSAVNSSDAYTKIRVMYNKDGTSPIQAEVSCIGRNY